VETLLHAFDTALSGLRTLFLGGAIVLGALCTIEWSVRTRRLSPFSRWARGTRRLLRPVMGPVERSIVRAGGKPSSAPWWTLVAAAVVGIVALSVLEFVRDQLANAYLAFGLGPRGVVHQLIRWTFAVLYIALLVRVIASWVRLNPLGRFVRWAYAVTEPMLGPLRRVLPALGMIDFSPLVAYALLRLIESLLLHIL
jgi:YggT family protein